MPFFKKLFLPKELKNVLTVLDSEEVLFDAPDFDLVKGHITRDLHEKVAGLLQFMEETKPDIRVLVLRFIALHSSGLVQSGNYHVYRGVLSNTGQNLLSIYNRANDELCKIGNITKEQSNDDKRAVREEIKNVG